MKTRLIASVVLVQALMVGAAVWPQLSARVSGQEVHLAVAPVDPIDPFRGAYVDLGYPDLPGSTPRGGQVATGGEELTGTVFVPLTRSGQTWVGGPRQRTAPSSGLYLRCEATWRLRCGIESLFLPQGKAADVGTALSSNGAIAVVRVDGRGNAALLRLEPRA